MYSFSVVNTRRLRAELARGRYGAESEGVARIRRAKRTRTETESGTLWRPPDGARMNLACADTGGTAWASQVWW
jgi:hypothetical protein